MRLLLLALIFSCISSVQHSIDAKEVIQDWAVWGPGWGRGGLGANGTNFEAHLRPQPGDVAYSLRTDRTMAFPWSSESVEDGVINFLDGSHSMVDQIYLKDGAALWAGCAGYGHGYLYSESAQTLIFDLAGSSSRTSICLNGSQLTASAERRYYGHLNQGWNRLLVKALSPSLIFGDKLLDLKDGAASLRESKGSDANESYWRFQVSYTAADGGEPEGLRLQLNDPERVLAAEENSPLIRYRTVVSDLNDKSLLFLADEPVALKVMIEVGAGVHEQLPAFGTEKFRNGNQVWSYSRPLYDEDWSELAVPRSLETVSSGLPTQARVIVRDYDDQVILRRLDELNFEPQGDLLVEEYTVDFDSLPCGYYTVEVDLLDVFSKVLTRTYPSGLSVLWGPVDSSKDQTARKVGAVGHWLESKQMDTSLEKLRWMYLVGMTRHQKMSQAWSTWGASHDQKGHVTISDSPRIDQLLTVANEYGISMVGDLMMGFPTSDKSNASEMALTEAEANTTKLESLELNAVDDIVFVPAGAAPLPKVGTAAYRQTMYDYAFGIVSRYKDRIHTWGGDNEIDLHSGRGSEVEARAYVEASQIIYQAMKDADPSARFVSGSLVRHSDFTESLFKFGFAETIDVLDVHAHPSGAPKLSDSVIGNTNSEGLGVLDLNSTPLDLPVWYGEFSAPLAHSLNGSKGQAAAIAKQVAWALKRPKIEVMSYLVPYSSAANLGFCSIVGSPHPATNAINVVNHLLDGREILEDMPNLPAGVQQLHVDGVDSMDTLLLWSATGAQLVEIPVQSKHVELVDLIGRSQLIEVQDATVQIHIGPEPQYLRAKF